MLYCILYSIFDCILTYKPNYINTLLYEIKTNLMSSQNSTLVLLYITFKQLKCIIKLKYF
jgi:hypothetical protein